jgi:DNA polymerase-1
MDKPLLVIDGDSFAHRSFHALPKTIRRRDGRGGGAIVGFANLLLLLFDSEQPRAVVVGWDTLDAPNFGRSCFRPIRAGGSSIPS